MSAEAGQSNWKLGDLYDAHSPTVNCLALSPTNGRTLVTGGEDRKLNLWIVGKPECILTIKGVTSPIQSVSFNSSENWVGAGSKTGVVKVFDLEEDKIVRSISGHKAGVSCLDFHRYGDILASGSMDTTIKVWDVRRKGCIFTYTGHGDVVRCIQFSPDGKWIVSASADGTAKLWDLSAGRLLADFKDHTSAVTSVLFHPRELLLATGSADRTAMLWDLETFEALSVCGPEATAVRKIQFHPDGSVLFTTALNSLRSYSWESGVCEEMVPVHWGKVADIAISGEQLIGGSFAETNVSLWCIDLKRLRPFSGEPASPIEKATQVLSASGRQRFEFQQEEVSLKRPFTQATGRPPQRPTSEEEEGEEGQSVGGEREVREMDSPPVEIRDEERKEIFAARQKLIRTPPKNPALSPFHPPPTSAGGIPPLHPSQFNSVVRIGEVGSEGRPARGGQGWRRKKKEPQQRRKDEGARNNVVRSFAPKSSRPQTKPQAHPPLQSQPSLEKMLQREIHTNHADVCSILESRLQLLREVHSQWSTTNPRVSVEAALNSGNQAVIVDILNVLLQKRTLWNLDITVLVLPELKLLLQSKYETYVRCGCAVINLVLRSFGPVIKTNINNPPAAGARGGGVDINKEERYEKCQTCHSHLTVLRDHAEKVGREGGMVTEVIRETSLLDSFTVLD